MSEEAVTSLKLSKQLSKYLPDVKTEWLWFAWNKDDEPHIKPRWIIDEGYGHDFESAFLNIPAWQIHELLKELHKFGRVEIQSALLESTAEILFDVKRTLLGRDARLVEALGKLMLWKVKDEKD